MTGLIALLITQLGHSRYRYREAASRALTILAPAALTQLKIATAHADAEVSRRAWLIYRPQHEAECERIAFGLRPHTPWLHLHDNWEQQYWLEGASKRGAASGGPNWTNYRLAAKLWAARRLIDGATVCEVQAEFERMQHDEDDWIARYMR